MNGRTDPANGQGSGAKHLRGFLPRVCRRDHRSADQSLLLPSAIPAMTEERSDNATLEQLAECVWASELRSMNVRSMIFAGARLLVGRDLQSPAAAAHSRHDIDQLH